MSSNVVDLEKAKQKLIDHITDNEPHFVAMAMCCACKNKWIATVHYTTSLFTLVCPKCNAEDSFGSIVPQEYLEAQDE